MRTAHLLRKCTLVHSRRRSEYSFRLGSLNGDVLMNRSLKEEAPIYFSNIFFAYSSVLIWPTYTYSDLSRSFFFYNSWPLRTTIRSSSLRAVKKIGHWKVTASRSNKHRPNFSEKKSDIYIRRSVKGCNGLQYPKLDSIWVPLAYKNIIKM